MFDYIRQRKSTIAYSIGIAFIACSIGLWRYSNVMQPIEKSDFFIYATNRTKLSVEGVIVREPQQTQYGQRAYVFIDTPHKELVQATFPAKNSFQYGDRIVMVGTFQIPKDFIGSASTSFPYVMYLRKEGVRLQFKAKTVTLAAHNQGNPFIGFLLHIKENLLTHIRAVLPHLDAGLLEGLILGENTLPKSTQDDFRRAGIIHIVVLSGYNMALVATLISSALSFLPLPLRLSGGAFGVVSFALLAGPSATVVRATLMVLIALLAKATGRLYDVFRSLCIAGILMIVHNPLILQYDPSFQLSFLATLGLIVFSPVCQLFFDWVYKMAHMPTWVLQEVLVSTCATQIMVVPFLIHMTGSVSLISLVANCMVLPFIPFAMSWGALATALSFISYAVAWPFAFAAHLVLSFILMISRLCASLPYASVTVSLPFYITVAIYVCYFLYYSLSLYYKNSSKNNINLLK